MKEYELAKNLLLDRTCETCKYNGLYSSANYMQLPECHYWYKTDRKHEKAINPPPMPLKRWCELWERK